MNSRIKELAKQARLSYVMTSDRPYIEKDLEDFAKLIVEECAKYIQEDAKKFPVEDVTWICGMNEAANVIKDHFGVK